MPVGLTIWVHRREKAQQQAASTDPAGEAKETAATAPDQPLSRTGGFQLVASNRYLRLIALLVLVFSLVNTLGGFILNSMITAEAGGDRALIGTMAGRIQTWVNLARVPAAGVRRVADLQVRRRARRRSSSCRRSRSAATR